MPFEVAARYAMLLGARAAGRVIAFLRHPFVVNALLLALIACALAGLDAGVQWLDGCAKSWVACIRDVRRAPARVEAKPAPARAEAKAGTADAGAKAAPAGADTWLTPTRVLAIWALLLIAWWVVRQRRRLLISRFDDLTGDKSGGQSLSLLLASELFQLRELFEEFEDGNVIQSTSDDARSGTLPGRSQLFEATVQLDAPAAFLETAISAESTLAVGPLKIPINALLGLVNRLVQGPRLAGQLQAEGGRRIVTVVLSTGEMQRQWRVEDDATGGAPRPLAALARELAYRMFADLAFERPVRWTAVAGLIEGLHAYRRTLRTTKEGRLHLHDAENRLQDAIAEDNRFYLAYYNLGVVYTALGRREAALSAFARAVDLNPARYGGHYALARARYALAHAEDVAPAIAARHLRYVLDHCDEAVAQGESAQARAKALNLKALAQMKLGGMEFFFAADVCRMAVRYAWRALLAAELALPWRTGAAPLDRELGAELAAGSLLSLSRICRAALAVDPGASSLVLRALRQQVLTAARTAAWLQPAQYDVLIDLGAIWTNRGNARRGIRVLRRAAQLAPGRGEAWCVLALAAAQLFRQDWVDVAYDKAIEAGGTVPTDMLAVLAEAMRALATTTERLRTEIQDLGSRVPSPVQMIRWASLLTGRRWRRFGAGSIQLHEQLLLRAEWVKQLEALAGKRRDEADRIARFAEHREAVERLVRETQDRTAELTKLHQASVDAGLKWEAGHAADGLGRVALAQLRLDDARKWFEAGISAFEAEHPAEIVRRGLYAQLSRALLELHEGQLALNAAHRAVEADPLSSFERERLAECYFDLKEWPSSRAQWGEFLRLDPDRPKAYQMIALCWFNEGLAIEDRALRKTHLQQASDHLKSALTLLDVRLPAWMHGQFLLGRIHRELGDVAAAQAKWLALESRGYLPVYLGLHIADSKLREVSLYDAETRFRRLSATLDAELAGDARRVDQPIDSMPGDANRETYGTAAAWADLGIALALARRRVGFGEALSRIAKARACVSRFGAVDERLRWGGICDRIEGELHFLAGEMAAALGPLERSLESAPTSDGYYYLAAALLDQLDPTADAAAARRAIPRIRALAELAEKLDSEGEFTTRLKELSTRLEAVAPPVA